MYLLNPRETPGAAMHLRRRKPVNPEIASKRELNRFLNHLLRRSRKTTADWELFDGRNEGRDLSWKTFYGPFSNNVIAVTSVEINEQTWWALAERKPEPIPLEAWLFGPFGAALASSGGYRIELQFWSEDPRTLDKPIWDHVNRPDKVKRAWIKTRKELAKLG